MTNWRTNIILITIPYVFYQYSTERRIVFQLSRRVVDLPDPLFVKVHGIVLQLLYS